MFKNFNLSNNEILDIINDNMSLINKYSIINGKINEDLKQEILIKILRNLRKNKNIKKAKKILKNGLPFWKSNGLWFLVSYFLIYLIKF